MKASSNHRELPGRPHFWLCRPVHLAVILSLGVLAACAVPQTALDQANNAGNLMQQLQAQEDKLAKAQALVAQGRINNIAEQRRLILVYNTYTQLDQDIADAAGDSAHAALYKKLAALSDQKAKGALDQQAALTALNDKMTKLLSAVHTNAKASADAQKAISVLGLQRNSKETFDFVSNYAKTLKVDSAPAATPAASSASAPHQAAPSSKPAGTIKE